MDFPLPDPHYAPLQPFWAGIAAREIRFPHCDDCQTINWYPAEACRHCQGRDFTWVAAAGPARIFAFTQLHRALYPALKPLVPYVPVLLTFDSTPGPRLVSRWVNQNQALPEIGQHAEIIFEDLGHPHFVSGCIGPLVR